MKKGRAKHRFPPPAHLSKASKQLWRDLVPRQAKKAERLTLLRVALELLDRADRAGETVAREGMTTTTERSSAVHINPVIKVEHQMRQQFVKVWLALGFQHDESEDPDWFSPKREDEDGDEG